MGRIKVGKHTAQPRSWDFGETDKGTEQVAIEFEIVEGEDAGEFITWYGFFTDDTEDRTLESLRNCGWQGDDVTDLQGVGSRKVQLVIEDESYQGKTHSRVRWVNRVGGNGVRLKKTMAPDTKRMLAARLRAKAQALPVLPPDGEPAKLGTPGPAPRTAPPSSSQVQRGPALPPGPDRFSGAYGDPPPRGDDDIPF
jgi:hypothetical protein